MYRVYRVVGRHIYPGVYREAYREVYTTQRLPGASFKVIPGLQRLPGASFLRLFPDF